MSRRPHRDFLYQLLRQVGACAIDQSPDQSLTPELSCLCLYVRPSYPWLIVRNARLRDIRLHCSRGSHCDPALLLLHWLRQQSKGAIFVHVDHVDPSRSHVYNLLPCTFDLDKDYRLAWQRSKNENIRYAVSSIIFHLL